MQQYHPARDISGGPNLHLLDGTRGTYRDFADGAKHQVEDSWKADGAPTESKATPWAGRTIFYNIGSCPQVYEHGVTDDG